MNTATQLHRAALRITAVVLGCAAAAGAADKLGDAAKLPAPTSGHVNFNTDIRPIFEKSCFRCHGPERPKSHFRLDNREDALKGGENGVDIVPGDSARSPLIHYVARLVDDMEMPPPGKGDPLTPGQVALLRAWIDQGANWGTNAAVARYNFSFSPTVNWTTVGGDERMFREHHWVREGWNGGVEQFELQDRIGKDGKATVEGHATLDDYKVAVTLEKRELGFTRLGWMQYRKYFDDSGGYFPAFTPSVFSLGRDLHLDQGRAWADFGLTVPDWPRIVVGYEYQYREGDKSTLQWGSVTTGATAKNILPNAKAIDEHVHVIKLDVDHDIRGYHIEDTFRGEFYDLETSRRNTSIYALGTGAVLAESIREGSDYFSGANALRVEKQIKEWWLGSAGYLYSQLNSEDKFSLDTLFPSGTPSFANQWRSHELVLGRETHAFNVTSMLGPWQGLTVSGGVLTEWTRQDGMGTANLDVVFPPPALITNHVPVGISSSYDRFLVEESVSLRYTTIPFTTLFAEARLQQDSLGENEGQVGGPTEFLRDTDAESSLRDFRVGFNSSPFRRVSFGAHYRRYEKESDFDDNIDRAALGPGYPAFIRWRGMTTDEAEGRVSVHPNNWLKTTVSYKHVSTAYETSTDPVSAGAPGDITPGGRLDSAKYDADVYNLNATFTPWQRLYLSSTFSYQNTRIAAFDNQSRSVAPYRGDVFSIVGSGTYALAKDTDLTATYSFSWADYGQHNFASGLPVGMHYTQHTLLAGLVQRWSKIISTRLQYGFYFYDEPSSGGANDYTAHAVLASMIIHLP